MLTDINWLGMVFSLLLLLCWLLLLVYCCMKSKDENWAGLAQRLAQSLLGLAQLGQPKARLIMKKPN